MKRNDWNLKALWMALQISPYQPRIGVFRAPFFRAAWRIGVKWDGPMGGVESGDVSGNLLERGLYP